jgi:hypothetical protein
MDGSAVRSRARDPRRRGVHPKSMPRIGGGTANPTVATLVAASVAYKVPLRELFAEEAKEP